VNLITLQSASYVSEAVVTCVFTAVVATGWVCLANVTCRCLAIRDFVNGEFHALACLHDLLGFPTVFRHWTNVMV